MTGTPNDIPGVVAPPPLVFLAALAAGFLLEWAWPTSFDAHISGLRGAGFVLRALGASLIAAGIWAFRRAGTDFHPYRPATRLITDGVFRYSRNPLYVSLTLIYLGLAFLHGGLWPLAALVPALAVFRYGVVAREEAYLERKFGDAYRSYKNRVRRWL
ncbi:MAG: isoprenylcysteine carboxylmethyltransferase family protein [Alphaproteobacteria bacterium]